MMLASCSILTGLVLLVWSADRFVDGAAATAKHFNVPILLIGIVIVGFGTSAPELAVSALASIQGNPSIALGNAYGSNIANIGLILGIAALSRTLPVDSQVLRRELPILLIVTLLAAVTVFDLSVSRVNAWFHLLLLSLLIGWSIKQGLQVKQDELASEVGTELDEHQISLRTALFWLLIGLILMIASSRILVWGSALIARKLGISDLMIGLTIVAIGTSLPELASSLIAIRKNEHDLVLGNVIGSNLFNTLAVVGVAGVIQPFSFDSSVLSRDLPVMILLTGLLLLFCRGFKGADRITRFEGGVLFSIYIIYIFMLFREFKFQ